MTNTTDKMDQSKGNKYCGQDRNNGRLMEDINFLLKMYQDSLKVRRGFTKHRDDRKTAAIKTAHPANHKPRKLKPDSMVQR